MDTNLPPTDPQAYADWVTKRIAAELKRRRKQQDVSAYELAVKGALSDQTVLNNEKGSINMGIRTLALHCRRMGLWLKDVVDVAEGAQVLPPPVAEPGDAPKRPPIIFG